MSFDQAFRQNQKAREFEKNNQIDKAIGAYEKAIEKNFDGNGPYDRLSIIYRKQKKYTDEIRVLKHAIFVFETLVNTERGDREPKLAKFRARLNRAEELKAMK